MIKARVRKLCARLRREKCQAAVITGVSDVRYLSGFTGEDSWLVIALDDRPALLTDSRFTEQARAEATLFRVVERKIALSEVAAKALRRWKAERTAFDPDQLTVRAHQALTKALGGAELRPVEQLVLALRQVKDAAEVNLIRRAIGIAERAFLELKAEIEPGMTEKQIADRLEMLLRERGAEGAAFETIAAVRERASLAHARPTDRVLKAADPLLIDWGARYQLYCSDLTRVILPGRIPPVLRTIYDVVMEAQACALKRIGPGVPLREVDAAARDVIHKAGHGKHFGHGLGHGVGLDVHELPHLSRKAEGVLKPGMIFTVEPGIYLPGRAGVRIEDIVLVTKRGCEVLSHLEK